MMDSMAVEAAENISGVIDASRQCSICLNNFKEPKMLPCLHTFCKSPCIVSLVTDGAEGQSLACPVCHRNVPLPENGVTGLQTDFLIEHTVKIDETPEEVSVCQVCNNASIRAVKFCAQCNKAMCKDCTHIHEQWGEFKDHQVNDIKENVTIKETTGAQQTSHESDTLPKNDFLSVLEPLKQTQNDTQQALAECDKRMKTVRSQNDSLRDSINSEFEMLHQLLDQRKATLLTKIQAITDHKIKEVAAHRTIVEMVCAQINSCIGFIESSCLSANTQSKAVAMRGTVLRQIKQLTDDFDSNTLKPQTMNDIELVSMDTADEACEKAGELVRDPVIAEKSYITGKGTEFAVAEAQSEVQIHLVTQHNRESLQTVDTAAELVSIKTRSLVSCEVENGSIIYRPVFKGKHILQIRANGKDIRNSPLPVPVTPSMEDLHIPRTVRNLSMPYGTATNSKGELIAIERHDYHKHCVTILSSAGSKVCSFGTRGVKTGHFDFPRDVTIDPDDTIFVADKDNHRIQKFTREGKFIAAVGCQGNNNLEFHCPNGIAMDRVMYNLYICDQLNHRIQVITRDLKFVKNFGSEGKEEGQFRSPMFVCFDERNNLYVTDFGNNRVQVFNDEGYFLRSFSEKANGEKLEKPFAIAIDSSNIVYVSEWEKNSISLFTAKGRYIMLFGSSGSKEGEFNKIRGIHIDKDDLVYVSDHKNNRVQIFN